MLHNGRGRGQSCEGEAPAGPPLPRRQRNVRKSPRWCEVSRRSVRFFRHLGPGGRSLKCQKIPRTGKKKSSTGDFRQVGFIFFKVRMRIKMIRVSVFAS